MSLAAAVRMELTIRPLLGSSSGSSRIRFQFAAASTAFETTGEGGGEDKEDEEDRVDGEASSFRELALLVATSAIDLVFTV
mmetsp:Transcript_22928/g.50515  ORF Transcript_22928/g.50515 Transcript_22928/m.50515 type:complete len:81 (-) Transcript_22928:405-647(-)